jgi:hypothetical protein
MQDNDVMQLLWHKDRTIEKQAAVIQDLQQLVAIMEDRLNLLYLENTILQGEREYEVHNEQVQLEL